MTALLAKLDSTRLKIASKTCLSIILALTITFRLDWKPSFMAILMCVLQTEAVGATYRKGLLYIVGTLTGATAGVAMIGLFAHDRRAFILGMALVTGFTLYRMQGSRYAYAWLIFLVTLAIAGWLPAQNPGEAFDIAVMRASTICLGVIVSFSVHGLLWPIRAGDAFERQLHEILVNCQRLLSELARPPGDDEPARGTTLSGETAQINAVVALGSALDAATGDTERFRQFEASYRQLLDQLRELVLAIIALRVDVANCTDARAKDSISADSGALRGQLLRVGSDLEALVRDLPRRRDGTAVPDGPDPEGLPAGERNAAIDGTYTAMIDDRIRDVAAQARRVGASLATVEDRGQPPAPVPAPANAAFSLASPRFQKAAISASLLVATSWFFILTQWPEGLSLAMIFAMLAIGFSGMLSIVLISRALLLSLVVGAAVAAPLYLGIMPGIDDLEELIPWLCLAFVPLLYTQTSRNPQTMLTALFSLIFCIILLSLDEENQSYSFSTFFNSWVALAGGLSVPILLFALLNGLVPEREYSKQVCGFFSGCGQLMRDLGKSPPQTPEGAAVVKAASVRWQGQLKQLQVWSSLIKVRRVPENSRDKTQALIASIECVALRLAAAAYSRQTPIFEPLHEQFDRLRDACIESCDVIAKALAASEPIPPLPATGGLIREIQLQGEEIRRSAAGDDEVRASALRVLSVTAHMHLLSKELNDCRDKANALDWKAWNRNWL